MTQFAGFCVCWKVARRRIMRGKRRATNTAPATVCRSINSDISKRTIESSAPKKNDARVLVNSVFPTPVGPEKKKLAIGRFIFLIPTLALHTARATADTASFCPSRLGWLHFSSLPVLYFFYLPPFTRQCLEVLKHLRKK